MCTHISCHIITTSFCVFRNLPRKICLMCRHFIMHIINVNMIFFHFWIMLHGWTVPQSYQQFFIWNHWNVLFAFFFCCTYATWTVCINRQAHCTNGNIITKLSIKFLVIYRIYLIPLYKKKNQSCNMWTMYDDDFLTI